MAIFTTRSGEGLQRAAWDLRRNLARLNLLTCDESPVDSRSRRALLRLVRTRRPAVGACGLMELRAGLTPAVLSQTANYAIVILHLIKSYLTLSQLNSNLFGAIITNYLDVIDNIWYTLSLWNTLSAPVKALYVFVGVGFLSVAIFTARSVESLQRAARDLRRNLARLNQLMCNDSSVDSRLRRALLRLVRTRRPAVGACGLMELRAGLTLAALSQTANYAIAALESYLTLSQPNSYTDFIVYAILCDV